MPRPVLPALAVALFASTAQAAVADEASPATGLLSPAVSADIPGLAATPALADDDDAELDGRAWKRGGGSRGGARAHAARGRAPGPPAGRPVAAPGTVGPRAAPAAQGARAHTPGSAPASAARTNARHAPARGASARHAPARDASAARTGTARTVPSHARPAGAARVHASAVAPHARPPVRSSNSREAAPRQRASGSARHVPAHRDAGVAHRARAVETHHRAYRAPHPRHAPPRWVPAWHRYRVRHVPHWHPRYWTAGIFVYSPPPPRARVVVVEERDGRARKVESRPRRAVDRNGDFGIGVTGGSYMAGYEGGGGFGDMGLGLTAQLRPVEAIGLQVRYAQHSQTWDDGTERINQPLQASVNLYAFPWTRVSPYLSAGLTWNHRDIQDEYWDGFQYRTVQADDTLFGPHGGLGVEFAVGQSAAVNFEADYIGYLNRQPDDPTGPSALQATMGLNFYF